MRVEQLFHSLHQSCKRAGGISKMARKIGVLEKTLIKKLQPSDAVNMPNVSEFIRIIDATGDIEPLDILCGLFGGRFVSSNKETASSILQAALHVASEGGDVMRAVELAMADGKLTEKERVEVKREIMQSIAALNTLKNTLDKVIPMQVNG